MKINNKLLYCYSCGHDVDHNGWQWHPNNQKRTHTTNVSQVEAHIISVASKKVQHKTLPGFYRDGKGWILAQQLRKANWVMNQQDIWKQQQQQQQWRGGKLRGTGSRTDKIDKQNLEPNSINSSYPTQHNTSNRFTLLVTTNDDEDGYKTTIIKNQTPNNM